MPRELSGVLPIVQTPFLDDESIDVPILHREVNWALAQGIGGLGTGMVSETLRLSTDERIVLTRELSLACAGRAALFMAVGAESAKQAEFFARQADQSNFDAVMAIPPISTKTSETELLDYFRRIADAVSIPLIVQDASSYVGQSIPLSVCVELLDQYGEKKILFKPEAAPIGPNISRLRDASGGRARMFEGSGGILLMDSYRRGVAGTMPGMEVVDSVVAIWKSLQAGDESAAYRLFFPLSALVALQMQAGLDGFLAIEKHILVRRGVLPTARRRRPYQWELDSETAAEVDRLVDMLLERTSARAADTA